MSAVASPSADALGYCRALTRRRARNFYYGLKLAPEPKRSALFAVYAWMRRADDMVDDCQGDPAVQKQRIESFRTATDAALGGHPAGDDPVWIALADVARRFDLRAEHFHDLLDGQLEDVTRVRYETFEQLRRYCYRVASAVGLICIEVWGYTDESARELAVERGIAFQLTNILRDYRQDFDEGRVYLPQQAFDRYELEPAAVRRWSPAGRCRQLILEQVVIAQSYYTRSAPLDGLITPSCRPVLWAMTSIYRGLLEKIKHRPARIVSARRLRLSSWHKTAIAVRARRLARAAGNGAS